MDPKQPSTKAEAFNQDVLTHGGYRYSTNAPLSSRLANDRLTDTIFSLVSFAGRSVIDIGCGDGAYTVGILESGRPSRLHATDLAIEGVRLASHNHGAPSITFDVASAYELPFADNAFEVAHLRGVLHHMDQPELAIKEALRIADQIVVAEPNGNNPGVKLVERLSPYHRAHQEKSYPSRRLQRWVRQAGGVVTKSVWAGLVPMFSPDWLAKAAKKVEPHIEASKLLAPIACSIYVFVAERAPGADRKRA